LDEIARSQFAFAGHAVDDFVVDADEHGARETVHERRRGARAALLEDHRRDDIELAGRDARAHVRLERVQCLSRDVGGAAESSPVGFGFDRHDYWETCGYDSASVSFRRRNRRNAPWKWVSATRRKRSQGERGLLSASVPANAISANRPLTN